MKKFVLGLVFCLALILAGCAGMDPAGPRTEKEMFPVRNQDPRWGLIVNEGTTHLNVSIYDEAGRMAEQIYLAGVNRFLMINGQTLPRYWIRQLEIGNYRLEIYPFFYETDILNLLFGQPIRQRIDLPKQTSSITVGRNPTATYDYGYGNLGGTYRHWGWVCRLNGGNIPQSTFPGVLINFQGDFNQGR